MHQKLTRTELASCKSVPWPSKHADCYYLQPNDLDDRESPLLLHPYLHQPSDHLKFGKNGVEAARELPDGTISSLGLNSIKVYDLKSEELRALRHESQHAASLKVMTCILAERQFAGPAGDRLTCREKAFSQVRLSVTKQNEPFCAAVLDFLDHLEQNPQELV